MWVWLWIDQTRQDVRYALRAMCRTPTFTTTAMLTLALGIGVANTAFGIINGVLIRGLPFSEPDRLVYVGLREPRQRYGGVSVPEYSDLQDLQSIRLSAYADAAMILAENGRSPERLQGSYISADGFDLLGVTPVIGRGFLPEDDTAGAVPVAVLGHRVWSSRYESDPTIIGRTVRVNGLATTIVGVMPAGFGFPTNTEIWRPLAQMPRPAAQERSRRSLSAFGRLTGNSLAQARQEVERLAARLQQEHLDTNKDVRALVIPLMERYAAPEVKRIFLVLLGAAVIVLLIACANVSSLLLVRAAYRQHEIATRVALGATRRRITRQLLVESLLLAIGAGIMALALSAVGIRLFSTAIVATSPPFWLQFHEDWRVFMFLAASSLASSLIFGLMPALQVWRPNVQEGLRECGRSWTRGVRARRWAGALVAAELGLTLVLLTAAGLMTRAFWSLYSVELGVETKNVTILRLDMTGSKYVTPDERAAMSDRLQQRLRTIPILAAATVATSPPGAGVPRQWAVSIEGQSESPGDRPALVSVVAIGDDYFRTLNRDLIRGQPFVSTDGTAGREHAIVNQLFASSYFASENPIGRRIRVSRTGNSPASSGWVTIIGVAPTISQQNALLQREPDAVVYLPYRTQPAASAVLLARGPRDAGTVASRIRAELLAIDPDLPVFDVQPLDQYLAFFRWPQRVFGTVLAILASLALIFAVVGLYGITAYSVAQRTHEIGVRMALGARRAHVLLLVLQGAILPFAAGLLAGIAGALAIGRVLTAFLVGTNRTDPSTLLTVGALLVGTGLMACLLPARRASRVDPLIALRDE